MAQLSEKVLSWLYGGLHEYHDARRTYSDAVKALTAYQSTISPRTEVYTNESGTSALLMTLAGTIPVAFRGTTYRFPIKIWLTHRYPHEPPIVFVVPGKDMLVRPGQHVGVDGRIYHPYLRDWGRMWEHAGIVDLLSILQQVFSKEPPVISKAQQQQYQRPIGQASPSGPPTGPPPPQIPPKQRFGQEAVTPSNGIAPPPRPPKPGDGSGDTSYNTTRNGPPLPPLPHEYPHNQRFPTSHQASPTGPYPPNQSLQSPPPQHLTGRQLASPPPAVPPLSHQHLLQPRPPYSTQERSPVSPLTPMNGHPERSENRYHNPPPLPIQHPQQPSQSRPYTNQSLPSQPSSPPYQYPPSFQQSQAYPHAPSNTSLAQPAPSSNTLLSKQPPMDLLSDPFDVSLPSLTATGPPPPAPPIPPNPEKEHLLHAISSTLVQQARQKVHQNMSAIAPLQAQNSALRAAHERLEGEIRQLEQLDQALSSNEAILRRSIQDCDRTIELARSKKQPAIDDVLIAPTMVANQLWMLCAEEAACREAMYVLQKAVDRGRVGGNDFVRQMRVLGRECFLKMALARKCAKGMGLDVS